MTKLSLTIKTDYVTSNRRGLYLQGKDRGKKVDLEEGEIYHQKAKKIPKSRWESNSQSSKF